MLERIISALGLAIMLGLAWLMSSHRRRVPWRLIGSGLLLQFSFAIVILWTPPGRALFDVIGAIFNQILSFVDDGAGFVFDVNPRPGESDLPPAFTLLRTFAFGVLPTIIFFSSLMSVLYYFGIMQAVVRGMAVVMQRSLGTSGAESLSAAANIFVGHTEAPLVIRPYIPGLTLSELNAVMVGGFATISGGLLAAYAGMGIDAGHLITASVISAPAALVIAKIMLPEIDRPETLGTVSVKIPRNGVNVIEAAANGASDGMKLALNVGAMLIAFLAMIAMFDALVGWVGSLLGLVTSDGKPLLSLALILGYVFAPVAWLMGIESGDCRQAGQLLGLKMVANEFIAFDQLGRWMADPQTQLSARSASIMTYALAGFSNFGAIGIQIAGIGGLAPARQADLARLGLRAMLGGALACCMTGSIAGILLNG